MCIGITLFVACSNAESDSFEDNTSNFESMKSLYGIESAATIEKLRKFLLLLQRKWQVCWKRFVRMVILSVTVNRKQQKDFYGDATDKKAVKMLAEYQARTRSGAFVEQFALCVSLNFNIDKGAVYYIGTTYSSSTDLFSWQGYGASLSTTADGNSIFNSTTYLYFRKRPGNCVVKVPVNFKGSYNFAAGQGTYSFTLKAAK